MVISNQYSEWSGLVKVCALLFFLPAVEAQVQLNPMTTLKLATVPALKTSPANASVGTQDALVFRNGDLLYGQLQAIDEQGVRWHHADVAQPIDFKRDNITTIDFHAQPAPSFAAETPCHVLFHNEESLDGNLVGCDAQTVSLDTWQAGRLKLPRAAIQSINLISLAPAIFAGPTGKEGWTSGKSAVAAAADSGEWTYKNGAFYAAKAASIARDLKLPDVGEIQFDMAWKGAFYVAIALYTDSLQPVNLISKENEPDFGGFYSLQLNGTYLDLKPITKRDPLRSLGQLIIPTLADKTRAHFDLLVSKPKGTVALFINGALVIEWKDPMGFIGQGTGMRFVHQGAGAVKLSGLRVTPWDGQMPAQSTQTNNETQDVAWLRNGTRSAGVIETIQDGKLILQGELGKSEFSLNKIRQLDFAAVKTGKMAVVNNGNVRATLQQGTSLTLQLGKWTPEGMTVTSPNLGEATFKPGAITRLQFGPFPIERKPGVSEAGFE